MFVGTGRSSRSTKAPSVDALLKVRLDSMENVSRPKVVPIKSPKSASGVSQDAMTADEKKSSPHAEIKPPPPPSRKRKLTVEFSDVIGVLMLSIMNCDQKWIVCGF